MMIYSQQVFQSRFIVQYFALFDDMEKAERLAHRKLNEFRHAKEFFKTDVGTAIHAIESTGVPFQARHPKPEHDRRIAAMKAEQYRKQVAESLRQEKEEKAILAELKYRSQEDNPVNKFLRKYGLNPELERGEIPKDVKERISALDEERQQRIKQVIVQTQQKWEQAKKTKADKEKKIAREKLLDKLHKMIVTSSVVFTVSIIILAVAGDTTSGSGWGFIALFAYTPSQKKRILIPKQPPPGLTRSFP